MMNCEECCKSFSSKAILHRHLKVQHATEHDLCEVCGKTFGNSRKFTYHKKRCYRPEINNSPSNTITHVPGTSKQVEEGSKRMKMDDNVEEPSILCSICKVSVTKRLINNHYKSLVHKEKCLKKFTNEDENIQILDSAFKSRIISYRISDVPKVHINLKEFMSSVKEKIISLIQLQILTFRAVKVNFEVFGLYTKFSKIDDNNVSSLKSFNTKNSIATEGTNLNEEFSNFVIDLDTKTEEFQEKESGWALEKILFVEININKYDPLRASSYIDLPTFIKNKKAIINVENSDQACFAWSIMAFKYARLNIQNRHRPSSYPHYSEQLVLDNISFPMSLKDIPQFEQLNNISVNVYSLEDNQIVGPLYYTKTKKTEHANLLMIEDGINMHYCYIKDLSRLVSTQLSKRKGKKWICDSCLSFFREEQSLKLHISYGCNSVKVVLPSEENSVLEFQNYKHSLRVPYIIYCDFESILKPINTCLPNPNMSFTENVTKHEACSFAYYIKCAYEETKCKFVTYRGNDCGKVFIEKLKFDLNNIYNDLNVKITMKELDEVQQEQYSNANICHICKYALNDDSSNYKVRDHCYLTGNFRGAAHLNCNLNYKLPDFIPIVCHNLSGYDAHFIIKELDFDTEPIDLIAQNKERYISFTKYFKIDQNNTIKLRFIDSFKFMASSLDKLSNNLEDHQFLEVRKSFPNENEFKLIKKKGVFPYEYIDNSERFNENQLPPQSSFFNKLNNSHINNDQYEHAKNVWNTFKCANIGEYSDLYLKSDVLILADIFENFRNCCLITYDLDPAHYFTAPGLSWDAMLKYTKIKMDLLTDIDMINFVNKGVRGGLVQCSKRYSKANHKYMSNYDPLLQSQYIIYLDANNLYGWAMSQYLPFANFEWLNSHEISIFDICSTNNSAEFGYILEVDIDYPAKLFESHDSFPFLPQNIKPLYVSSKQPKLIANLLPKTNYVIHQENLKQCLTEGLILKKIHRVLKFNQKPWLKPYIDLNTNLRFKAKNAFEKDFYKLMNNSVFGKTLEDVSKRKDIRLLTHWENIRNKYGASRLISKPNFHSSSVFSENLVAIQMNRLSILYNKPIYVGFCVLDISKTLMYDFHYHYIRSKYNDNASLLYTDTDSLIYEIKTNDFFKDIRDDIDSKFDTSDFPPENIYGIPLKNKKVLGMFKDECCGKKLTKFIGLKAKTYCLLLEEEDEVVKKIKGIKKSVVSDTISFNDFKNCLNKNELIIRSQQNFRSSKHDLYTQLLNKLALSNFDDKRFVIPNSDSNETLAWGNDEINKFYFV